MLNKENISEFFNDEENPILNINEEFILELLKDKELDFEKAYYSLPCPDCGGEKVDGERAYTYKEFHFYIYTKNNEYVTNSMEVEKEGTSFNKLQALGKVDNSYIVSIIECSGCNKFTIEIEEFEI